MSKKKFLVNTILGITLFLLSSIPSYAGFGVSPTNISSEHLKPGASFVQDFVLSRSDFLDAMTVTISPDLGEMQSWFTFEPGDTFSFSKGEATKTFQVVVNVPQDAKYTDYAGVIRITAVPSDQAVRGVSITQGVRLDAGLTVTEEDYRNLSILSVKALDSQEGKPIRIEIVGQNLGNVDASPTMKVSIKNLLMETLEEHELSNFGFVKPNETSTLLAEFSSKLPTGEYFIIVQVLLDGKLLREERLVFNIVNIPAPEKPAEQTSPFQLGTILNDFKRSLPYVLISSLTIALAYLLLEKIWRKKSLKTTKKLWWAVMLGSNKVSRIILSATLGITTLLVTTLYPLIKVSLEKGSETNQTISFEILFDYFKSNFFYLVFSFVAFVAIYLLLEKIWKSETSKKIASKWWAILLGSKKVSRLGISIIFGIFIFLLTSTYAVVTIKTEEDINNDKDGETQGVQNIAFPESVLNVFPSILVQTYPIHQDPNVDSEILYMAEEGEEFKVLYESELWYKVQTKDNLTGWLEKSLVTSKVTREK